MNICVECLHLVTVDLSSCGSLSVSLTVPWSILIARIICTTNVFNFFSSWCNSPELLYNSLLPATINLNHTFFGINPKSAVLLFRTQCREEIKKIRKDVKTENVGHGPFNSSTRIPVLCYEDIPVCYTENTFQSYKNEFRVS